MTFCCKGCGDIIPYVEKSMDRNHRIIINNIICFTMNLILCTTKVVMGNAIHSTAVVTDGLNSLSDVISAVFIILFARLAAKKADDAHPFGYGRLEYICSILITMVVIYLGFASIINAIRSIASPGDPPNFTTAVIVVMIISMLAKTAYGLVTKKTGEELNSESMMMTGSGSIYDAIVAASILMSIVFYKATGILLENYLSLIISALIIKTGFDMLSEALTKIIGAPVDPEYRRQITQMIAMEEGVYNVSSLVIHNYGENNYIASVDIEVDENMKVSQISKIRGRLKEKAKEMGLVLTSVGVIGVKTNTPEADIIFDEIIDVVRKHKGIIRVQSYRVDFNKKKIAFEVVQDHRVKNEKENLESLKKEVSELFPDMSIRIYSAINA